MPLRLDDVRAGEGTHEGGTYGWMTWARARGRAPTRGAPTVGLLARAGEGTHKGGTYGWMTWARGGGHPRGVPLRLDYLRARGGHPRGGHIRLGGVGARGEGTHEGGTYGWIICAHGGGHPRGGHIRLDYLRARGRAPTRGGPVVGLLGRARAGEGTHEGCPYGWVTRRRR